MAFAAFMSANEKLTPGMVLGRYELLLPIAQGGMATVWAARQKGSRGFQKTVAIKTILPNLSDDAMFEQMFLDEAALAAKIHHPNVAEILDLGEQDEILYLVMEWVDGEALSVIHKATRKSNSQLPARIAVRIAMQACQGLHAAHELRDDDDAQLGLVHRDVSPQNILVTYDGVVKLVDFGVAKATGRASGETSAGQLKGKVPYMSPEQARGGNVDRRTDIFAMGIVLYKMTTGTHPFLGDNDLVTMRNIISRPLLPPRVRMPAYPQELEQVLLKCLQKDPEKRYQSMLELGVALERALVAMGVSSDDDIGSYVRLMLGDRGQKRRGAIREAARLQDERPTPSSPGASAMMPQPQQHEAVSEIVLTQLNSGVHEDLLPDAPTSHSSTGLVAMQSTPAGSLESQTSLPIQAPPQRSRGGVIVAGLGVVALGLFGAVYAMSGRTPAPLPATPAARPTASATAVASAPAPAPSASGAAAPEPSAINPAELPSADDKKKLTGPLPAGGHVEPAPSGKPSAAPSAVAAPTTPRPVSSIWQPTVQNPGF
jgi:serine/threonine-protein kinase